MNFKLAVVFLFALVALGQAQMPQVYVFHTYSDASCNDTSLIAITATNDPYACLDKKRSAEQVDCSLNKNTGLYEYYDYSYCGNDTFPTFPADWQVVQLTTDSACNSSSNSTFTTLLAAPKNFGPTPLLFASSFTGFGSVNASLSCNATSGNLAVGVCLTPQVGDYFCLGFDLEANVCTADNAFYATQTTCVAPPVAVPVAEPVATPTTSTTPTATTTPVKTPSTKTSTASIISGTVVALLSLAALM